MPRSSLPTPLLTLLILCAVMSRSLGAQTADLRATDQGVRAPGSVTGTGPNGATIRCRDGSHPPPMAPDVACQSKGGVLLRYPIRRTPGAAAAPALVAAPAAPTIPAPRPPARVRPTGDGVIRTARPPADATLLCTDGTYIKADTSTTACTSHGGVRLRLSKRRS